MLLFLGLASKVWLNGILASPLITRFLLFGCLFLIIACLEFVRFIEIPQPVWYCFMVLALRRYGMVWSCGSFAI